MPGAARFLSNEWQRADHALLHDEGREMKSRFSIWVEFAVALAIVGVTASGAIIYQNTSAMWTTERVVPHTDIESDLLRQREEQSRVRAAVTHRSILVGHLLVLGLLILADIAMYVDRKKRGEAEGELLSNQAKLGAIVDSAMDAIISIDEDQRVVLLNPAAEAIFRCNASQMIGRPVEQFIPERFREAHRQSTRDFSNSSVPRRNVGNGGMITGLRADGTEFPVEASISQTTVDGGKLLTIVLRDVSERETSRLQLREQAAMLDQVRDAIHVCDLCDCVVYWNRGSERLYGWTAEEMLGKNVNDVLLDHCEEPEVVRRTLMEQGAWAGEITLVIKDGRQVTVERRRTLIRDDAGRPSAQLVIDIDMTARKKADMQERRSQRLESIGTLAGGIAHDLNNVLTPIMMGTKLLVRGRPESDHRGLIETIRASAERGAEIIKQLLVFAGGVGGKRESLQSRDILHEIKNILDHTLPKTIQVNLNVVDDLWPVFGDATELSQVLMNLCVNARDAMPEGGTLTISAENVVLDGDRPRADPDLKPGPHLLVTAVDTGMGIPPEVIDSVFDPFFTTKQQSGGTGLGLSTSLGIIRSHGGSINVYSEPGQGTKFTIYLPTEESERSAAVEEERRHLPHGNGELVLLVDDEALILEIAGATLEAHSYKVLTANSGTEALATYQHRRDDVQVVLLDMMMPVMDGLATMKGLRAIDPQVRIIASSGLYRPETDPDATRGVHAFLRKPYSDEQLLKTLRQVLDENRQSPNP